MRREKDLHLKGTGSWDRKAAVIEYPNKCLWAKTKLKEILIIDIDLTIDLPPQGEQFGAASSCTSK